MLFLVIGLTFISCIANKKMHEGNKADPARNNPEINSGIFSARSKMFINDFRKTITANNIIPDTELIDKYSLSKINDIYYLGMLLKISGDFDLTQLYPLNAIPGSRTNASLSVKLPIQNVDRLSGIKGIEYVDIDHKIILKNNR